MLDIATPKKNSFYHKLIFSLLSFKTRHFIDERVKTNVYYEYNLDQFFKLEHYVGIFNSTLCLSEIETPVSIQPGILGLNTKAVIRKHGNPKFIFSENDVTIFVYKWRFNGLKNRCKVHFYKDKAFLVNHDYQSLSVKDKLFIRHALAQKYLNPAYRDRDMLKCKIADQHGNIIFANEVLLGLSVNYLSGDQSEWFLDMTDDIAREKNKNNTLFEYGEKKFYAIL